MADDDEALRNADRRRRDEHLPFLAAASRGDVGEVRRFLDAGTPVNAKDRGGRTALHHAVWRHSLSPCRGLASVVEVLLERGAHPHAHDVHEVTPAIIAAKRRDAVVLQMLKGAVGKRYWYGKRGAAHDDGDGTRAHRIRPPLVGS